MNIHLHDVTLCAVDCVTPALAADALQKSSAGLTYGDVFLLTDTTTVVDVPIRTIPSLRSRDAYSSFILRNLVEFVQTSHVLIVQWDGFVLDPRHWRPEFLRVDYIGAQWGWFNDGMTVGNGGFSLRSRKLLEATAKAFEDTNIAANEDVLICREHRRRLEQQFNIVFASPAMADRFSYERTPPAAPTFGFHGMFNFWRHLSDQEVLALLPKLPPGTVKGREYLELLLKYLSDRKFSVSAAMFQKIGAQEPTEETTARLSGLLNDPNRSAQIIGFLSSLA
jgi:hypothetical protein